MRTVCVNGDQNNIDTIDFHCTEGKKNNSINILKIYILFCVPQKKESIFYFLNTMILNTSQNLEATKPELKRLQTT